MALDPSAPAPQEIDSLIERCLEGNQHAWNEIVRLYWRKVFNIAYKFVGRQDEAEDLTQDIFVRAWERLTMFRGQSSLATWLHRLATNVVLERMRANKRDALRLIDSDSVDLASRSSDSNLDTRMDLDRALVGLPGGARTVFVLHDIEGYSHDEIATMTGIAPGTARAQLCRARRALMKLLDL